MSEHASALSFFTNRRIGSKISIGFAAVLLVFAVSSVFAWLTFGSTAGMVQEFAGLVERTAVYRDIDQQVTQYRGHVREYLFSDDEATAAMAVKEGDRAIG